MDSAELLDLLGNANRRRILRLLAEKPCYVTEISECLGVSPKAVIDHLERLETAGLIESRVDDKRRKYYYISENLRLEVSVSPYGYGAKSAYPASDRLDLTAWQYLSIDVDLGEAGEAADLARELDRLESLERELSMAQRWVQGRIADVMEELNDHFEGENERLYGSILSTLADGAASAETIGRELDAPPAVIADALEDLRRRGVVRRDGGQWELVG